MPKIGLRDFLAPWIRIAMLKRENDRLRSQLAYERKTWTQIGTELNLAMKHLDNVDLLRERLNAM